MGNHPTSKRACPNRLWKPSVTDAGQVEPVEKHTDGPNGRSATGCVQTDCCARRYEKRFQNTVAAARLRDKFRARRKGPDFENGRARGLGAVPLGRGALPEGGRAPVIVAA